jgi:hypothetical protein
MVYEPTSCARVLGDGPARGGWATLCMHYSHEPTPCGRCWRPHRHVGDEQNAAALDEGRRRSRVAAPLMHYAFGALVGALHGACADRARNGVAAGVALGTMLWLTADEIAMPVLGLSAPTTGRPLEMHVQSLAAHLVYGLTAEAVRRRARTPAGNGNGAPRVSRRRAPVPARHHHGHPASRGGNARHRFGSKN